MIENAAIRVLRSPIDDNQLRDLDPRCRTVQFSSALTKAEYLTVAEFMSRNPNVWLRVYGDYDRTIRNLDFLQHFGGINHFSCDAFYHLENIDGLAALGRGLLSLGLGQTKKKFSLGFLERFQNLKALYLENQKKHIEVVTSLRNLEDITLRSVTLPDLFLLAKLPELLSVDLKLGGTKNLEHLKNIPKLRYLEIWRVRGLSDISFVGELKSLQFLFLQHLPQVVSLPDFSQLNKLRRLHIDGLKAITEYDALATAANLEELFINAPARFEPGQFKFLAGLPTLKAASIGLGGLRKNEEIGRVLNLPSFPFHKEFSYT